MKIKEQIFLALLCLMGMVSCIIPKEARILKRETKDWRESSVVLEAYADSPLSSSFLKLRENGKFEHTSSGLLKYFEAGTWINNQDSLILSYLDNKQSLTREQKVKIDRQKSTLIFEGDTTRVQMRLRIMVNKIF